MQHWQWIENDISKVGHFKSSSPLSDVQQHNQTKSFKRVAKRASDRSGQLMPCLFALSQQISTAFYPCLKVTKLNHENDLLDPPNINMHKTSKCKNQNLKKIAQTPIDRHVQISHKHTHTMQHGTTVQQPNTLAKLSFAGNKNLDCNIT